MTSHPATIITEARTWLTTDQAAHMLAVDEQVRSAQRFATTPGKNPDPALATALAHNYPELHTDTTSLSAIGHSLGNYYANHLRSEDLLEATTDEWTALTNLADRYDTTLSHTEGFTAAISVTNPLNSKPHTLVVPDHITTNSVFHDITPGSVTPRIAALSIIPNPTQGTSMVIEWQDTAHGLQKLRATSNPHLAAHAANTGPWMPAGRYLITWQGHDARARITTAMKATATSSHHSSPALLSALADALDAELLHLTPTPQGAALCGPSDPAQRGAPRQ